MTNPVPRSELEGVDPDLYAEGEEITCDECGGEFEAEGGEEVDGRHVCPDCERAEGWAYEQIRRGSDY